MAHLTREAQLFRAIGGFTVPPPSHSYSGAAFPKKGTYGLVMLRNLLRMRPPFAYTASHVGADAPEAS